MKPIFSAPREMLEKKPPHGAPCNRCGLCCMASLCPLGQHVFGLPELAGPCPALERDGGDYRCGIVADPAAFAGKARAVRFGVEALRRAAMLIIGAGDGCDARFNGERRDEAFAADLDRKCDERAGRTRKAKRMWGDRAATGGDGSRSTQRR